MDVYLVRSSLVVDDSPEVPAPNRYLSAEGRQILRAIGNKLRLTEEPSFDRVITSPLAAAVQSAELFADRVDYVGVIEVLPTLAAASAPASVIASSILERGQTVAVIADEPVLASVGAFLVGRPTFPPALHAQVSFVRDRTPVWCLKPGESGRSQLLVA